MSGSNKDAKRDEVLFALHKTFANPTARDIAEWVKRHPEFADDIRSHASIIKDWAAGEGLPQPEPDDAMISRSHSRAMNALHKARAAAEDKTTARTFEQIMAATGTDIPALAKKLDIKRGILAALVGGRMLAPVGERLVSALTDYWSVSAEVFDLALQLALTVPKIGIPKADSKAAVIARSYEELVRSSEMTEARKKYWLGED